MDGTAQNYLGGSTAIGLPGNGTTAAGLGAILSATLTNGGSGYVDGTYTNVSSSQIVASGNSASFTVTVLGGIVTSITLTWGGVNFAPGDTITINNTSLGGTGSGLVITVVSTESDVLRLQGATNLARLTLLNTNQTIASGDEIGLIRFSHRDASAGASGTQAYIQSVSTGTEGGADLAFGLKTPTAFSVASEIMKIRGATGALLIGSASQVSSASKLEVTGQGYFSTVLGIGTASLNASAKLQVDSTTQGVLFPRMTTTQKNAISSPATGLVVFDTTLGKLCVYSTTWQTITSV